MDCVTTAYEEVIHSKKNLFAVPFDKVGKEFVQELSCLLRFLWREEFIGIYCIQSSYISLLSFTAETASYCIF